MEVHHIFSSKDEWISWLSQQSGISSGSDGDALAARIMESGFVEPLTGLRVTPEEISNSDNNWREGLVANGLSSRIRAVVRLIEEHIGAISRIEAKILAAEGVTNFSMLLRGIFPRFIGTEYSPSEEGRRELFPIPHQDFTAITYSSNVFDIVTTNEVLEHIPNIDAALSEIARVLKPGGWHIGTMPFLFMQEEGNVRAKLVDGEVVHLMEPEWHGNPIDPEGGALVFETPAWNILARARAAGFARAEMHFVASETYGYVTDVLGVFVFCAQK